MTYCIGLRLDKGLVFMSDTRTSAGVDNFAVDTPETEKKNQRQNSDEECFQASHVPRNEYVRLHRMESPKTSFCGENLFM